MPLTAKQADSAKCPAAEVVQPVLSPNPIDIECRVIGTIAPVGMRPCNGDYANCPTWKRAKQNEAADRTVAVQALGRRRAPSHTVSSPR